MIQVHLELCILLACILLNERTDNSCVNWPFVTSQKALIALRSESEPGDQLGAFKLTPSSVGFWRFEMFCLTPLR